jgi:LysR family hydrogen peroxide-inducible transcriptional activator
MNITLTELRYMVAVADEGQIGLAADACHVAQPTLSTGLKKLEEKLGVTIFERNRRSVEPTPAGRQLIEQARDVLEGARELERIAKSVRDPTAGTLRLGIIATIAPYFLPSLLPAVSEKYPDLEMTVVEGLTERLLDDLENHNLDAVLLALPWDTRQLKVEEVFEEQFRVLSPPDQSLGISDHLDTADLPTETLLLLSEGHCLRDHVLNFCDLNERTLSDFQSTSLETLRELIRTGRGYSLFPEMAISERDYQQLEVLDLEDPPSRTISLAWRKTYPNPDLLEELSDLMATHRPMAQRTVTDS